VASGCFRVVSRLARRTVPPRSKIASQPRKERRQFNAQTFMTASGIIRQPHCPKLISLLIGFRIRERNTY
jgi:hypothetical protein